MQDNWRQKEKPDLISVIVPVYNTGKFLNKCLDSLINQTYQNIEIILVNDGSTDCSAEICKSYKITDPRIVYIEKINGGVSSARNVGLDIAKGEYISFVDSDDYIATDMFETMHRQIIRERAQICTLIDMTVKKSRTKKSSLASHQALQLLARLRFPTSMWAYMYHRDVIANLRVASNIHFFEDFLFNFYALAKASQISLMHGDFYKYLVNDESTNRQKVNDRRLTCLSVYEMIKSQIADKALKRRMQFFRMHCLLSVILAVAKDVHSDRSYYHTINLNARKMAAEVQFSPFVPLNYKMIHLAALTSPGLLIGFLRKFKYHDT